MRIDSYNNINETQKKAFESIAKEDGIDELSIDDIGKLDPVQDKDNIISALAYYEKNPPAVGSEDDNIWKALANKVLEWQKDADAVKASTAKEILKAVKDPKSYDAWTAISLNTLGITESDFKIKFDAADANGKVELLKSIGWTEKCAQYVLSAEWLGPNAKVSDLYNFAFEQIIPFNQNKMGKAPGYELAFTQYNGYTKVELPSAAEQQQIADKITQDKDFIAKYSGFFTSNGTTYTVRMEFMAELMIAFAKYKAAGSGTDSATWKSMFKEVVSGSQLDSNGIPLLSKLDVTLFKDTLKIVSTNNDPITKNGTLQKEIALYNQLFDKSNHLALTEQNVSNWLAEASKLNLSDSAISAEKQRIAEMLYNVIINIYNKKLTVTSALKNFVSLINELGREQITVKETKLGLMDTASSLLANDNRLILALKEKIYLADDPEAAIFKTEKDNFGNAFVTDAENNDTIKDSAKLNAWLDSVQQILNKYDVSKLSDYFKFYISGMLALLAESSTSLPKDGLQNFCNLVNKLKNEKVKDLSGVDKPVIDFTAFQKLLTGDQRLEVKNDALKVIDDTKKLDELESALVKARTQAPDLTKLGDELFKLEKTDNTENWIFKDTAPDAAKIKKWLETVKDFQNFSAISKTEQSRIIDGLLAIVNQWQKKPEFLDEDAKKYLIDICGNASNPNTGDKDDYAKKALALILYKLAVGADDLPADDPKYLNTIVAAINNLKDQELSVDNSNIKLTKAVIKNATIFAEDGTDTVKAKDLDIINSIIKEKRARKLVFDESGDVKNNLDNKTIIAWLVTVNDINAKAQKEDKYLKGVTAKLTKLIDLIYQRPASYAEIFPTLLKACTNLINLKDLCTDAINNLEYVLDKLEEVPDKMGSASLSSFVELVNTFFKKKNIYRSYSDGQKTIMKHLTIKFPALFSTDGQGFLILKTKTYNNVDNGGGSKVYVPDPKKKKTTSLND